MLAKDLGAARDRVRDALVAAVRALADDTECSSIHWLFCTAEEQAYLATQGYFPRASLQFHWHNRGYASFDDFLGALKSRKRKQLRKERARARAAIECLTWVPGRELDAAHRTRGRKAIDAAHIHDEAAHMARFVQRCDGQSALCRNARRRKAGEAAADDEYVIRIFGLRHGEISSCAVAMLHSVPDVPISTPGGQG